MHKYKWFIILILFILDILLIFTLYTRSQDRLIIAFLDIGQGDAIFIETPGGNQMLIDAGANAKILEALSDVMPWYDPTLDVVIATHPDTDHIGGIPDVLKQYTVTNIMETSVEGDTPAYEALHRDLQKEGSKHVTAQRGQIVNFGDGVYLRILFPDRDMKGSETNTASIVAQLIYGETEVLLTGDAPKGVENYLVNLDGKDLASDVLKAGHHGSDTSSGETFVAAVAPIYSVVSAGKDNRYGHPHQKVLETLQQASSTILGTYDKGTIVFESDGKNIFYTK